MSNDAAKSPFSADPHETEGGSASPPVWANLDTLRSLSPLPGIIMYPISGRNLMINFVRLEADALVPLHHHPHEQGGTVLEGTLILTIDGETRELRIGDAYIAPPDSVHGARGGPEGALVIDIFSPPREDYLAALK